MEMTKLHAELEELRRTISALESENTKLQTNQSNSIRYLEWQRKTFPEVSVDEQDRLIKLRLESESMYPTVHCQQLEPLLRDGQIQIEKDHDAYKRFEKQNPNMPPYEKRFKKGSFYKKGDVVAVVPAQKDCEGCGEIKIHLDDFGILASTLELGNDEVSIKRIIVK